MKNKEGGKRIRNKLTLDVPKGKEFHKHKKKYKGVFMNQSDNVTEVFKSFFLKEKFDRIIDIGTSRGGFTLFLAEQEVCTVYTFDIEDSVEATIKQRLKDLSVRIFIQNIFETNDVIDTINMAGRSLILCDNGDKFKELKMCSKHMSINDVIMVHDYLKDVETYHNQNIWKTCAFMDEYVKDDTLISFYQDEFAKAFWMCRIKQ